MSCRGVKVELWSHIVSLVSVILLADFDFPLSQSHDSTSALLSMSVSNRQAIKMFKCDSVPGHE